MRADNSQHLVDAARRRAQATRRRALTALRRWTTPEPPSPSTPSPARRASPGPGSTASPTCAPKSNGAVIGPDPPPDRPSRTASAPPNPPCCVASRSPPSASANWRPTTSDSATPSPKPSANTAPPMHAIPGATRRHHELPRPRAHAERHRHQHCPRHNQQATAMIVPAAPDKPRVTELSAAEDHQEPWALPQRRRRDQAAMAGHPRHRGQTRPPTRQGERPTTDPTHRPGPARRRCGRAGLEGRPRRPRAGLPRPTRRLPRLTPFLRTGHPFPPRRRSPRGAPAAPARTNDVDTDKAVEDDQPRRKPQPLTDSLTQTP